MSLVSVTAMPSSLDLDDLDFWVHLFVFYNLRFYDRLWLSFVFLASFKLNNFKLFLVSLTDSSPTTADSSLTVAGFIVLVICLVSVSDLVGDF